MYDWRCVSVQGFSELSDCYAVWVLMRSSAMQCGCYCGLLATVDVAQEGQVTAITRKCGQWTNYN